MKILFLTQVLPYPLTGGQRIRAYYMLRHLSEKHEVTLVSFIRDDDLVGDVRHLRQFCRDVITVPMKRALLQDMKAGAVSLLRGKPAVVARDDKLEMRDVIKSLVSQKSFDAVHADQTSMAIYGLLASELHGDSPRPITILDQHNALFMVVQRQSQYESGIWRAIWRREAKLLEEYEARLCRDYDHIFTVTQNDKDALRSLLDEDWTTDADPKMQVVPICVDPCNEPIISLDTLEPNFIFVGSLVWPPNTDGVLWFTEEVLPLIVDRLPTVQFTIVGKDPSSRLKRLIDDSSPVHSNITIAGFVPDLDDNLARNRVFIVPLRAGGGMRVKIVHAWMKGIPVVSTAIGAEGLEIADGENILIANDPAAFADSVLRVIQSVELADTLRVNGRRTVEQYYDYRRVYSVIDPVYASRY